MRLEPGGRALRVVGLGDSHTNGQIHTVTVAGAEKLGNYVFATPKDQMWNGTAVNPFFKADCQINTTTNSTDANVGLGTGVGSYLCWLPGCLRAAYASKLDIIRIANLGVGGACAYTWAGEQPNAYFRMVGLPQAGDSVTVDGVTYTFVANATNANEVTIAANNTDTGRNLANAINAEGTGWGAGTTIHPSCNCANPTSSEYVRVTAIAPGTAGNSKVLAANAGGRVTVYQQFANGSAASALWTNGKAALNGGTGFGTPDVFLWTLGTNDVARPGYRGRAFQAAMTTAIANVKADYPTAKHIIWRTCTSNGGAERTTPLQNVIIPAVDAIVAADPANVFSVDMWSLGAGSGDVAIISNDGTHLTPYGHAILAQLMASKIAQVFSL